MKCSNLPRGSISHFLSKCKIGHQIMLPVAPYATCDIVKRNFYAQVTKHPTDKKFVTTSYKAINVGRPSEDLPELLSCVLVTCVK